MNGVNFITLDDVFGTVSAVQVEKFHAETKKGLPIVLCMRVPFFTDGIALAHETFWHDDRKYSSETKVSQQGDLKRQREDSRPLDFEWRPNGDGFWYNIPK